LASLKICIAELLVSAAIAKRFSTYWFIKFSTYCLLNMFIYTLLVKVMFVASIMSFLWSLVPAN